MESQGQVTRLRGSLEQHRDQETNVRLQVPFLSLFLALYFYFLDAIFLIFKTNATKTLVAQIFRFDADLRSILMISYKYRALTDCATGAPLMISWQPCLTWILLKSNGQFIVNPGHRGTYWMIPIKSNQIHSRKWDILQNKWPGFFRKSVSWKRWHILS